MVAPTTGDDEETGVDDLEGDGDLMRRKMRRKICRGGVVEADMALVAGVGVGFVGGVGGTVERKLWPNWRPFSHMTRRQYRQLFLQHHPAAVEPSLELRDGTPHNTLSTISIIATHAAAGGGYYGRQLRSSQSQSLLSSKRWGESIAILLPQQGILDCHGHGAVCGIFVSFWCVCSQSQRTFSHRSTFLI